jgi:hypothetical protein
MSSASGTSSEERAEILSSMNVVGGRLKLKGVTIKGSRYGIVCENHLAPSIATLPDVLIPLRPHILLSLG